MGSRDAASAGPAGLHCLEAMPPLNTLADFVDDGAQGSPHRHLDKTCIDDLTRQCEDFGALAALRADAGEPFGTVGNDGSNISIRFDVVDQGGSTPESTFCREGRARAWLASLALDAGNERSLLATDECSGPQAQVNMETEGRAQDAISNQFRALRLPNSRLQPFDCQGIFRANVDVSFVSSDSIGGYCHAFQYAMGVAFQNAAVHERAGITLVGVADHKFTRPASLGNGAPLQASGIARATATTQTTARDLINDLARCQIGQRVGQLLISTNDEIVF